MLKAKEEHTRPPSMSQKPISLAPVFFTVLLSFIGMGIVLPIFPQMLIDPNSTMLAPETTQSMRKFLLGVLLAAHPIANFFSSPILGGWSDRVGRKKILQITLVVMVLGYFLTGIGAYRQDFLLLLIGRAVTGFSGGNTSIAYAVIADISPPHLRAKNFSYIPLALSVGFILGPVLGGNLSDKSIVGWFDTATPFWFASIVSLLNIFLIAKMLPETLKAPKTVKVSFFESLNKIKLAFTFPQLRFGFLMIFLYYFAWNTFFLFLPLFLIEKFKLGYSWTDKIYVFMGMWMIIFQFALTQPLSKRYSPDKILKWSMPLFAFALFILILPGSLWAVVCLVPVAQAFQALTHPNAVALSSLLADEKSQGQVMGINQSMQAIAKAIAPALSGALLGFFPSMPVLISCVFVVFAWGAFLLICWEKKRGIKF